MAGVARGGLFLFIGLVIASILGYIYWVLVSYFGGNGAVGVASAVLSLSVLVSGIAQLGLPNGVQRFLGKEFGHKNLQGLNTYFWSSLVMTFILSLLASVFVWIVALVGGPFMGFSEPMLISVGIIVLLSFSAIIGSLFSSIIKTEYVAISNIVSGIAKLALGAFLVYFGFGWFGAVLGLILGGIASLILMLFYAVKELKRLGEVQLGLSFKALGESLHASFASWFPGLIALFGQQLGILAIFGIQGQFEAGTYFIAYVVFSIISSLPASFMSILFPVLSGSDDPHGRLLWRAIAICLALGTPLSVLLILYARVPLMLIGAQYATAAPILAILASSLAFEIIVWGVISAVYAAGHYGKVLGLNLAVNVPRITLYFLLVPIYGGFGAALSFLMGSLSGFAVAAYVTGRLKFEASRRKIAIAIAVPFLAALPCYFLGFDWLIGGTIILLSSIICYGRLGVVERSDLKQIARGFASEKTIARVGGRLDWLLKIVYGD